MYKFLFLSLLISVQWFMPFDYARADHLLPKHNLKCSADFPCPPEIRGRVDFWIEVFKGWDKTKAILHDPNVPERVYAVITTGHGCSSKVSRRIKANRTAIKKRLNTLADNLANKRKITNKKQLHYLALFPNQRVKSIRNAAKNIRCQSGVKDSFVQGLKRFNRYSGMVDRILAEANLPPDIRYLPFVESSYNPAAYSKVGAAGLWQIMPATARSLGLELNATVDERLDPEAATRAAAKYLRQATTSIRKVAKEKDPSVKNTELNPFVITSYNYGVNGMRRAIRKVSPDYMEVINKHKSPSFQVAVKNFYASFLAARHVALNADLYFGTVAASTPLNSQSIVLQTATSVERIKKVFRLTESELKPLNDPLTRFIWNGWRLIPAGYQLRLPARKDKWQTEINTLLSLPPEKVVPGSDSYVVRKGDTACGIARALRVNCSLLIKTNNLGKRAIIRAGQKLSIPRKIIVSNSGSTLQTNRSPQTTWAVKPGDTACGIAKRAGVSCRELIQVNRLGRKAQIHPGQVLTIPQSDFIAKNVSGLNADNQYIVQKGDAACGIARRFSVNCKALINLNGLSGKARIYPGQKLSIPGLDVPKTTETAAKLASAEPTTTGTQNTTTEPILSNEAKQLSNLLDTLPDMSVRVGSRSGNPIYYIFVESDETLGHFADWLGIGGSSQLRKLNNLKSNNRLKIAQRILLPQLNPNTVARFEQKRTEYHQVLSENLKENFQLVGIETYRVKAGDTLWNMAQKQGFPLWLLYRLNPTIRVTGLSVGNEIKLPRLNAL